MSHSLNPDSALVHNSPPFPKIENARNAFSQVRAKVSDVPICLGTICMRVPSSQLSTPD